MGKLLKSNGYLGDFEEDSKVFFFFSTFDKTEDSFDLSGDTGVDTEVYKNNSETPITDGVNVEYNVNGAEGVNRVIIDLSESASYTTLSDYVVTRLGSTIDSETVNAILAQFSIENRYSA